MASGVKVSDEVVKLYNLMKIRKTDGPVRLAVFDFKGEFIDVDEIHTQQNLNDKQMDCYDYFRSLMTPSKCRYILYDCQYATKDLCKDGLVFVMWCPPSSKAKDKLNYAASKETLLKKLTGIKFKFEWTDNTDCLDRRSFAEELSDNVISIEGVPTCGAV